MLRVLLAFESSLYAAVTPVLPHYAHTLHASKPAIGLLAAAYAAGIIPGSLIGGWAAARAGVRRTTVGGLLAFAVTGAAFGFATDLVALDLLRVLQGLACGFIWGGGLAWAIAIAPRERRGAVIGSVIGAAIFGTLVGPLLGVFAVSAGTAPVFSAVGVAAVALALWVRRHPNPGSAEIDVPDEPATIRVHGRALLTQSGLWLGAWLVLIDAMSTGAVSALLPLRLSRLGASGVAIGATFVLASAVATLLAPVIGRASDRHGARRPMTIGLLCGAALFAAMTVPSAWLPLAAVSVLLLGGPMSAFMIPAVPMMTASAERVGVTVVVATSLVNLAYAVGETIGAPTAALLSTASSDAVPFVGVAGLMLVTLVLVRRSQRTARPAQSAGPPAPVAAPRTAADAGPTRFRPPRYSPVSRPSVRRPTRPTGTTPPIARVTADHACSYPAAELTAAGYESITGRSHLGVVLSLPCPRMKPSTPFLLSAAVLLSTAAVAQAAPVAPPAFTVSVFAGAPSHASFGPDDITSLQRERDRGVAERHRPQGRGRPAQGPQQHRRAVQPLGRGDEQVVAAGQGRRDQRRWESRDRHRQRGRQLGPLRDQAGRRPEEPGRPVHLQARPGRQGLLGRPHRRRDRLGPDRQRPDPRHRLGADALGPRRDASGSRWPRHHDPSRGQGRVHDQEGQGRHPRRRALPRRSWTTPTRPTP